jgi:taurine dioxygenase
MPNAIDLRPLAGAVGAEISGVDLRKLDDGAVAAIRRALLRHGVLFFREQSLDDAALKAFAGRFGPLFVHPFLKTDSPDPAVVEIRREPGDARIVGEQWHADTTMTPEPPMGAVLYALEVPPYGGDTLFASQCAAYDALSDGMKKLLAGLRALHSDRLVAGPRAGAAINAGRTTKVRADADWRETVTAHPVVRTHPETGRKLLFVNRSYTVGFENMSEEESRPLLEYLFEQGDRPEFTCRFRWTKGSIAFWDNRAVKHLAIHDAGPHRRVMRRVQIAGDRPV